jgi:hypothetical protein
MYGDFSRMTFTRAKQYSAVWSQQGRVQLDADINEQTSILLDWLRTLAVDFIGPFGGHVTRGGFHVDLQPKNPKNLTFSPGHYYVYGLRCELPPPTAGAAPTTYRALVPTAGDLPAPPYLVYLAVWERTVSAVADPGLLEPALGPYPPDTTIRTQVAWAPRVSTTLPDGKPLENVDRADLKEFISQQFEGFNTGPPLRPLLAARVERNI